MFESQDFWDGDGKRQILKCVWEARRPGTLKNYCYALRKFFRYMTLAAKPLELPIDAVSACDYLAFLRHDGAAIGAVKMAYNALKWAQNFVPGISQYNDPLEEKIVKRVFESALRTIRPVSNIKAPLTKSVIDGMFKSLTLDATLRDIRDVTILAVAFTLLLRHDEVSHLSCAHLKKVGKNLKVTVIRSKTDKLREGRTAWLAQGRTVQVVERYMKEAGLKIGQNHFLFGPIYKGAVPSIGNEKLSYNSYRQTLKRILEKQGIDSKLFGFHSCRSGGATELASSSTQLELLKAGRWKDQRSLAHYVEIPIERRLQMARQLDELE